MPDKTLDMKGLACPLPILKTKKALSGLPKGATLEVLCHRSRLRARFQRLLRNDRQPPGRAERGRRRLPLRHRAPRLSARLNARLNARLSASVGASLSAPAAARRSKSHGKDAVSPVGISGMKVSEICLGTMMFGGPTERGGGAAHHRSCARAAASTSSTRPTSIAKGRSESGDRRRPSRPSATAGCWPPRSAQVDRARRHRQRPVAAPRHAGRRGQPRSGCRPTTSTSTTSTASTPTRPGRDDRRPSAT